MKIYTKQGDQGYTKRLGSSDSLRKSDELFEAVGALDELNAFMGLAIQHSLPADNCFLQYLQGVLLAAGTSVAAKNSNSCRDEKYKFSEGPEAVQRLENTIDQLDKKLPKLCNFILPGGNGLATSHLHVCRVVCRRAERACARLEWVDPNILQFLNRMSDFFFVLARAKEEFPAAIYRKHS